MAPEEATAAAVKALSQRAAELGAPLSEEDAAALGNFIGQATARLVAYSADADLTEETFNAQMARVKEMTKERLDGILLLLR